MVSEIDHTIDRRLANPKLRPSVHYGPDGESAVKRINWGQAFAEVALLLLGIGLALVVDQWREQARDRVTQRSYLTSLRSDFETADSILNVRLSVIREQLGHNEALLRMLAAPVGSVPGDSIAAMLRKAFVDIPVRVTLPSYQDLINAGDLRLLRDEELRRALFEFDEFNRSADGFSRRAEEQWNGPVTDFFVTNLNATLIYGEDAVVEWDHPGAPSFPGYANTPPVSRISIDPEAYWGREMVNRIAIKNVTLDDAAFYVTSSLDWVERIFPLIDASLEQIS